MTKKFIEKRSLIKKRISELGLEVGFQEISIDNQWIRADVVIRWLNIMERKIKKSKGL